MSPASTSANSLSARGTLNKQQSTLSSGPKANPHKNTPIKAPASPTSPSTESKSTLFSDLFSEEMLGRTSLSPQATSPFTSPRLSGSPDLQLTDIGPDPEQMAKEDPLATQVWKMYARTKANLPHAQRMENLTWRMMALALKKKKEEEEEAVLKAQQVSRTTVAEGTGSKSEVSQQPRASGKPSVALPDQDRGCSDERGRRIDKGKGKVRVVGFDGTNQDGIDEPE
jgi:GATA-binding protein